MGQYSVQLEALAAALGESSNIFQRFNIAFSSLTDAISAPIPNSNNAKNSGNNSGNNENANSNSGFDSTIFALLNKTIVSLSSIIDKNTAVITKLDFAQTAKSIDAASTGFTTSVQNAATVFTNALSSGQKSSPFGTSGNDRSTGFGFGQSRSTETSDDDGSRNIPLENRSRPAPTTPRSPYNRISFKMPYSAPKGAAQNTEQEGISKFSASLKSATTPLVNTTQKFAGMISPMSAFIGSVLLIKAGFNSLSNTINNLISKFLSIPSVVAKYVEAFNPAVFQIFELAIRDLTAVIGAGLQPILEAFTLVIRTAADALVPIIEMLAPAFSDLSVVILAVILPAIFAMADAFQEFLPMIKDAIPVLASLAGKFGSLISSLIIELSTFAINILNLIAAFKPFIDIITYLGVTLLPHLVKAIAAYLLLYTGLIPALIAYITSTWSAIVALGVFIAEISTIGILMAILTAPITLVIGAFVALSLAISWIVGMFSKKKTPSTLGDSTAASARRAEYSSVEDLSKNLIKAAFGSSGNDRLKNIDDNGKKQTEILEKIKKNQLAGLGFDPADKLLVRGR